MREWSLPACPFDAVLLIAFGGPRKSDEVRPFVQQVVSGRGVPHERIEEVIGRYDLFGGVSPITEVTFAQADGLQGRLKGLGLDLPVYVGMRNWHPFIKDTLVRMSEAGVRRVLGFIAAGHQSYASCGQYKRSVALARQEIAKEGLPDIEIVYVDRWYDHELFISAWAEHIQQALGGLDADVRDEARIIFSAHSIPVKMARPLCLLPSVWGATIGPWYISLVAGARTSPGFLRRSVNICGPNTPGVSRPRLLCPWVLWATMPNCYTIWITGQRGYAGNWVCPWFGRLRLTTIPYFWT